MSEFLKTPPCPKKINQNSARTIPKETFQVYLKHLVQVLHQGPGVDLQLKLVELSHKGEEVEQKGQGCDPLAD